MNRLCLLETGRWLGFRKQVHAFTAFRLYDYYMTHKYNRDDNILREENAVVG